MPVVPVPAVEGPTPDEPTPDELDQMLGQLHAMECAVRAQFLMTAALYAAAKAYLPDGARDLGEWLAGRFAISSYQARELARVAEAVAELPNLFGVFSEGRRARSARSCEC